MHDLPKVYLHASAKAQLPTTGQRRDMLMKKLRAIQVSPKSGTDFQWPTSKTNVPTNVTVCVGYAISWFTNGDTVYVVDIRGQ